MLRYIFVEQTDNDSVISKCKNVPIPLLASTVIGEERGCTATGDRTQPWGEPVEERRSSGQPLTLCDLFVKKSMIQATKRLSSLKSVNRFLVKTCGGMVLL